MLTLDTHLAGVTATAPHPNSYRPDLPLNGDDPDAERIEAAKEEGHDEGYNSGHFDGREEARADASADERALTHDLVEARKEIAALRAQLAQKSA